ncbi:extracellular matrix protein [Stagonosporopsis vannaccii]|nr:extracellular matrix protein [Stagonosporopsis vannaccii]
MRFFQMVASSAAFIAAALALEINDYPTGGVQAGQTYTITYSPADNTPTTFILRKGLSTNLGTIGTLTTTATGGTFSWTVARDLADGADYALEIQQEGETPNYSGQFGLTGGSAAASSSASASASASSASASSVASVISSRASSASSAASASISSVISSALSSATGTVSVTASTNGTISSATLSRTASGTRATGASTSPSIPESTGAASSLSSAPLALLLGAAGAFAFLN